MAQSQSKMIQEEYYEEEYYEEEQTTFQDKLVLYIEEVDSETKISDMRCFIVFDEYEKEYLINGMRRGAFVTGCEHRFYCKKRKNLLNYFKSIFDPKNEVRTILYNYSNENNDLNQLHFRDLYSLTNRKKEIVGYDDVKLMDHSTWKYIEMHLKNLKYVRY